MAVSVRIAYKLQKRSFLILNLKYCLLIKKVYFVRHLGLKYLFQNVSISHSSQKCRHIITDKILFLLSIKNHLYFKNLAVLKGLTRVFIGKKKSENYYHFKGFVFLCSRINNIKSKQQTKMIQSQCQTLQSKTVQQHHTMVQMLRNVPKKRKQLIWTNGQNQVYVQYLKSQREFFRSEKSRRKQKVFVKLGQSMESRTAEQCRSHHQRLMISHKSISKIIKYLDPSSLKPKKRVQINFMPEIPISPNKLTNWSETPSLNQQLDLGEKEINLKQASQQSDLWRLINVDFWLNQ